jgi:hypothetical protein
MTQMFDDYTSSPNALYSSYTDNDSVTQDRYVVTPPDRRAAELIAPEPGLGRLTPAAPTQPSTGWWQ